MAHSVGGVLQTVLWTRPLWEGYKGRAWCRVSPKYELSVLIRRCCQSRPIVNKPHGNDNAEAGSSLLEAAAGESQANLFFFLRVLEAC